MSTIKRFGHYWRENINAAKEGYEMIVLIVFIVWQACFFICKYLGLDSQIFGANYSKIPDDIDTIIAVVFVILGLLWLPFRRFETQARAINSIANQEELERIKEKTHKLDKDILGAYLRSIEHQIIHVKIMDWFTITDELAEKEIFAWSDMKVEISDFLKKNFSGAEAAYFGSDSGMHQTPIGDNDELLLNRKKQRQFLLDQMAHHSKQLKAIIEKLM